MTYYLSKSTRKDKKFVVIKYNEDTGNYNTLNFGAYGYSDYTIHKDIKRKNSYIARHSVNEDWTKKGINTAGFWSKWILWNKENIKDSIRDTEKKFNIKIVHIE